MKKITMIATALALVLGLALVYGLRTKGSSPSDESRAPAGEAAHKAPKQDPDLELLTILGDVANSPRDVPGRWKPAREAGGGAAWNPDEKLSDLTALPYVQGSRKAPAVSNVTVYDRERAYAGLNTYTSGHAPEALVMDMEGRVLHKWQMTIDDLWPEVPRTFHSEFWRRIHVYPDGDLLAIFEGIGMVRLDRHSRVRWAFHGGCHHEAYITDDGRIYVLTRKAEAVPQVNPRKPVLRDAVTELDGDGNVLSSLDILDCFFQSEYVGVLTGMRREGDILHTNSLYVFDGSLSGVSPYFQKGNILISVLKVDALAVIDPREKKVVWAVTGKDGPAWHKQHDPRPLANGRFLLFDNQGHNGRSRVLEFVPSTLEVVWQYSGEGLDSLYSKTCGTSRRLPNGNTLITESDNGRALEVTPEGRTVWEFYNPYRAGDHNELIASLFELTRHEEGYFPWLERQE